MLAGCTPWPAEDARRYRALGLWRDETFGELVAGWAARHGARTALVSGERRLSYADLEARSARLAAGLLRRGLAPGDRVVVQLPNGVAFVDLTLALLRIGALPVMALPAHRHHEIAHLVAFAEAAAYAVPGTFRGFDYLGLAARVAAGAPGLRRVLVAGGPAGPEQVDIASLAEAEAPVPGPCLPRPDPDDVALFLLSGGTTGLPKLIPRTHNDYAYNARRAAEVCRLGPGSVYLAALPAAHNFPLACPGILGTFHAGGRVVMAESPRPEVVLPLIEREGVTITAAVPAVAIGWMDSPLAARHDLSSLELLQVGGSRFAPEAARRVRARLGATVQQAFGMAEGLVNLTRPDDAYAITVETQGRPMCPAAELRIVDEAGRPVGPGQAGELLTRGPYTIRGYFRAAEHNARAFTPDGYYRTGDVVREHPSGNLLVEGRIKDLINRGGEKISAEEIENLVLAHPAVRNVAVVAMPDPVLGERICACVTLAEDARLELAALTVFLEARGIARFKCPERLEVLAALPLTSVGKVDKNALRAVVAAKLEGGPADD